MQVIHTSKCCGKLCKFCFTVLCVEYHLVIIFFLSFFLSSFLLYSQNYSRIMEICVNQSDIEAIFFTSNTCCVGLHAVCRLTC